MGAVIEDQTEFIKRPARNLVDLPVSFDSRDQWPNCPSISEIQDQGSCGCCWAYSTTTAMTDRECIATFGAINFPYSAQYVTSCCKICGLPPPLSSETFI
jgi:cathepsin B